MSENSSFDKLARRGARAVQQRYEIERRKRLRKDGLSQYVRLEDELPEWAADPFNEVRAREPKTDHVTFAFVGGGFSGLVTCARLREAGINDIRIIDRGGDFGGTWYWNQYPGAQCDTASMVYMPLLEETGYCPSEKYAHGPEILAHCQRIGKHYGLYSGALFHTEVIQIEWDESCSVWRIRTNRQDNFTAKYVGLGIGELHIPKLPGIEGFSRFKGRSFHSSRWDYGYTGGDPMGSPMTRLAGKRVGVIGTGATAVQCVPELARSAGELFVFQRTPSSVFPRRNEAIDPAWFKSVATPGWQQRWMSNFAANRSDLCIDEDLVKDGWTSISRRICEKVRMGTGEATPREDLDWAQAEVDIEYMQAVRRHIDSIVQDRDTADRLKPWYGLFCKRPCFHDEYLEAFNAPNTHLVDTDGRGVDEIVEDGVVAGGRRLKLDCIIYASGFEAWTPYVKRLGFDPVGRPGLRLSEHWSQGVKTLHGVHVRGFPNLFVVDPTQGASLFSNITHNIVVSAETISRVVRYSQTHSYREVEVSAQAESDWVRKILQGGRVLGSSECTPGRYNYEGEDLGQAGRLNAGYPAGAYAYFRHMAVWCASGRFEGLEFR
jgi:cyclohexanone monooxygenase